MKGRLARRRLESAQRARPGIPRELETWAMRWSRRIADIPQRELDRLLSARFGRSRQGLMSLTVGERHCIQEAVDSGDHPLGRVNRHQMTRAGHRLELGRRNQRGLARLANNLSPPNVTSARLHQPRIAKR